MRYCSLPEREDEPWEQSRSLAEATPDELADYLPDCLITDPARTSGRHAYSDEQVSQVRLLFRLGDDVTDGCLHLHLDEFAITIGLQARIEPSGRPAEIRDRIERDLIAPVASLKRALEAFGLRRKFLVGWGVLRDFDLPAFEDQLAELERLAALHIERQRKRSRKGRGASTLLKAHHVERAYDLACYLNPRFHPQRPVKQFLHRVRRIACGADLSEGRPIRRSGAQLRGRTGCRLPALRTGARPPAA
jgi:hypothetical protein